MTGEHTGSTPTTVSGGTIAVSSGTIAIQGTEHDGTTRSLVSDTGHLVAVETTAHLIHQGRGWVASHFWPALGAGLDAYVYLLSGSVNVKRAYCEIAATVSSRVYFYQDPRVTGGTAMPLVCLNRLSPGTATTTIFHTPTVISGGRLLWQGLVPAAGVAALGGAEQHTPEWILPTSTGFLIQITNMTAGAGLVSINISMFQAET